MNEYSQQRVATNCKSHLGSVASIYNAGLAMTVGIPIKFGTAHGKLRPEVGSVKCIGFYDRKGVFPSPRIFGASQQKTITHTDLFEPIHNFYSFTIIIYVDRTNIYRTVAKRKFFSHRLQC